MEIDEPVWNHAVFSKNRDRLLNQEVAQQFFAKVKAKAQDLMSDEPFHSRWHADRGLGESQELPA